MNLWLGGRDRFCYISHWHIYICERPVSGGGRAITNAHSYLIPSCPFFPLMISSPLSPLFWTATLWWYTSTSHTHLTQQPTCRSLISSMELWVFLSCLGKTKSEKQLSFFLFFFCLFLCCYDSKVFLFCSPPMIGSDLIWSTYLHIPYHLYLSCQSCYLSWLVINYLSY